MIIEEGECIWSENGILHIIVRDIVQKPGSLWFRAPEELALPERVACSHHEGIQLEFLQPRPDDVTVEGVREVHHTIHNREKKRQECPKCGEAILPRVCRCKYVWDIHKNDRRGVRLTGTKHKT